MSGYRSLGLALLIIVLGSLPVHAQGRPDTRPLDWLAGPAEARLGDQAVLVIPDGYAFLGPADTRAVLTQMGNFSSGEELGLVAPVSERENWFVVVRYMSTGYVRDDDAGSWDPRLIMAAMQTGAEAANQKRTALGIPILHVTGWEEQPRYDQSAHTVTWAVSYEDEDGLGVNYHTLALGRDGYISMNMVGDLDLLPQLMGHSRTLLASLAFVPGQRYGDFDPVNDRLAPVGLTAVIAGAAYRPAGLLGLSARLTTMLGDGNPAILLSGLAIVVLVVVVARQHRKKPHSPLEA